MGGWYLHEPAFLQELPSWGQDARDAGTRETLLDGEHLLEVLVLADVLIDVGSHSSDLC